MHSTSLAAREDAVIAVGLARARAVVALAVPACAGRDLLGAAPVGTGLARAVRRAAARLPPALADVAVLGICLASGAHCLALEGGVVAVRPRGLAVSTLTVARCARGHIIIT